MFTDHPDDTDTDIWTSRGMMARAGLAFGSSKTFLDDKTAIAHTRAWVDGAEIVRSDVWIEILERPACAAVTNEL